MMESFLSQVIQEMLNKVTEDLKRHIPKDWSLEVIEISDDEGEEEEEEEEEETRAPPKRSQPNIQGWDEERVVDKLRPYVASLKEISTQDYCLTDTVIPDTVFPSNLISTLQETKKILRTGKEVDKLTWFHLGRAYKRNSGFLVGPYRPLKKSNFLVFARKFRC